MQHNRAGRKLRRSTPHRLAMFSNQLTSLMTHERIQTTLTKAKELRPLAEKLITTAKADGVEARRRVFRWIPDRTTVKRVFETIAPRFVDRPGGYTRILRLGARKGDAAEAAILELGGFKFEPREKGPRKESPTGGATRPRGPSWGSGISSASRRRRAPARSRWRIGRVPPRAAGSKRSARTSPRG